MEIITAIISGIIGGIFTLVAVKYKHHLENKEMKTKADNPPKSKSVTTKSEIEVKIEKKSIFFSVFKFFTLIIINFGTITFGFKFFMGFRTESACVVLFWYLFYTCILTLQKTKSSKTKIYQALRSIHWFGLIFFIFILILASIQIQ